MNYGQALKSIREEKKMTQKTAALKAKVSQTYLSQVESNTKQSPSKSIIAKLCKVYKIPPVIIHINAIEESDVPKANRHLYSKLKPVLDSMCTMVITGKVD